MTIRRIPIFQDSFGDGNQDLPVLSGAGSVTEAGGALVVSVPGGTNADWWTWGRNGILPFVGVIGTLDYTKIYYEFTIKSWTTTNPSYSHVVVGLCASDTALWWLFTQDGTNFGVQKNWGGSNLGAVATTLPRKFRYVWDKASAVEASQTLAVQYLNNSGIWTDIVAAQAISMTPVRLGFGVKNWNLLPACSVQIEDVEIYAEDSQKLATDASALEDNAAFPNAGGAPTGTLGVGGGQQYGENSGFEDETVLPSAGGNQTEGSTGLREGQLVSDPSGIEDTLSFPTAGGSPDRITGIPEGFLVPADPSALEETYCAEVSIPAYVQGINDADGRSFLGDTTVPDLQVYDTTGEQWASPTGGNGFYGAGRDGKFYNDGYECGPTLNGTSFGTLAAGYNKRTWMTNVEPSAIQSWTSVIAMQLVSDDHLKFNTTTPLTSWNDGKGVYSRFRWCLVGDFDIQVSYENRSVSGGTDGNTPALVAAVDDNSGIYVRRRHDGSYDSDIIINGSYGYYVNGGVKAWNNGKLRIVRSGTTVSSYYWNTSAPAWVLLRTGVSSTVFGKPMRVEVACGGIGSLTITRVDVFGFTINSGTPVNTAGWAREVAGTYRGSRSDFPEKALVSATRYAVDIIDIINNKLWMRFAAGANNALHNASVGCRRVRMKNGILLIPYNSGGDICVDFTTDDIRIHSASAETWTGAILKTNNGVYFVNASSGGRDCGPVGVISGRNLGGGYNGDFNQWQIPSTTVYDADLYEAGGYLYKVHATASGIGGHKWRRWYNDGTTPSNWWNPGVGNSAETSAMPWCQITSNGDLFYLSATTVYSANFATWSAKVNSGTPQTWTADYSKPLPGTRDAASAISPQGRAAIIGSNVFIPANEGVYRAAWPLGSFALEYGWSESGAAYPILGWNPRQVYSIRAVYDSLGAPLLAIGVHWLHDRQIWSQVILVNPATHTVYGVSPARKARTIQALAV